MSSSRGGIPARAQVPILAGLFAIVAFIVSVAVYAVGGGSILVGNEDISAPPAEQVSQQAQTFPGGIVQGTPVGGGAAMADLVQQADIVQGAQPPFDDEAVLAPQDAAGLSPAQEDELVALEAPARANFYSVFFTDPASYPEGAAAGGLDAELVTLLNSATSTIDAAMFELDLNSIADALIAAHQRGVLVRVVYDDEHTEEDPQMARLIAAGIPATPDERSAFMHNKFYVIDRQIVWTGSTNATLNDYYRNNNNVIVIRSSRLAQNYTVEFEQMFFGTFGPSKQRLTPNPIFTQDGVRIENYFAPEEDVISAVVTAVAQAQEYIHFMAFAFTQDRLGQAMLERAAAGVEVAGIFEQRGAATEYSECGALLNFGLNMFIDGNPRTFHHKVIIIDGRIVVTGSFNFSNNAVESNDENLLIIHDAGVAALYEQEFQRRLAEAQVPVGGVCRTR